MVDELKRAGLSGEKILKTWVERRVQPLQARETRIWEYAGASDPSRLSPDPLSKDEVIARIQPSLKGSISLEGKVKPFCASHPQYKKFPDFFLLQSSPPLPGEVLFAAMQELMIVEHDFPPKPKPSSVSEGGVQGEALTSQEEAGEGAQSSASPTKEDSADAYLNRDLEGGADDEAIRKDGNSKEPAVGNVAEVSGLIPSLVKEGRSKALQDQVRAPGTGQRAKVPWLEEKSVLAWAEARMSSSVEQERASCWDRDNARTGLQSSYGRPSACSRLGTWGDFSCCRRGTCSCCRGGRPRVISEAPWYGYGE